MPDKGLTPLRDAVLPTIILALKEDIGPRDLTTAALIPKDQQARGDLVARQEGLVAGLQVAEWTFGQVDPKIRFKPIVPDGRTVHPGQEVAFLEGPARGILTAERVALNFLGHLSGIATLTQAFVNKVQRTRAQILDTRKTTPGLRLLEKYAVAVGGGVPHRMGLYDQVLIKDNHLQLVAAAIGGPALRDISGQKLRGSRTTALGPVAARLGSADTHRLSAIELAVKEAREKSRVSGTRRVPDTDFIVEVEVSNLQEFRQALAAKADIILLDNMSISQIQEVVRLRNAVARTRGGRVDLALSAPKGPRPLTLLEVSGGVTLETVEKIAAAGVDRISIGALTHSAPSLDFALELVG